MRNSLSNSGGASCMAAMMRMARVILRNSCGVGLSCSAATVLASINIRRGLIPSGQAGMHRPQPLHWLIQSWAASCRGVPSRNRPRTPSMTPGSSPGRIEVKGVTGQTSTHLPQAVQSETRAARSRAKKSSSDCFAVAMDIIISRLARRVKGPPCLPAVFFHPWRHRPAMRHPPRPAPRAGNHPRHPARRQARSNNCSGPASCRCADS